MEFTKLQFLLDKLMQDASYRRTMQARYDTRGIPIKTEELPEYMRADVESRGKPDRRLYNHFEKEIVSTKVAYFLGEPPIVASYNMDSELDQFIDNFNISNNYEDLFSEITKSAAITGRAGVLLYKTEDLELKTMQLDPAEFMVFYKLSEPVYALRRFDAVIDDLSQKTAPTVEFFDKDFIYTYTNSENGWVSSEPVLHGFSRVPIIEVVNNKEKYSDYHSAVDLIDAYNRLISDASNEVESFRLAYLLLVNLQVAEEDLRKLRQTGVLSMDENGDARFLTKNLDTKAVEIMKEILEANIVRFAEHVMFSGKDFTGTLTRIAVHYRVRPLEQKVLTFELKFRAFLRELYRTVFSFKGLTKSYDYTDLTFRFTRNLPVNLVDEVDMLVKLKGHVSDKTRLGMMSFIENPDDELELIKQETPDPEPEPETNQLQETNNFSGEMS